MTRSMRIDIASTHAALQMQNQALGNACTKLAELRSALDFNQAMLSGQGYGTMWRYCHKALIPTIDALMAAAEAQADANNEYRKAMSSYLPSMGSVSMDDLLKQREDVDRRINALEGSRDYFSSFPGTQLIVDAIDRQIAPLLEMRSVLRRRIDAFLSFLETTDSIYAEAEKRRKQANDMLAGAQEGWSPRAGYSSAYQKRSDSEIAVPDGAKPNGPWLSYTLDKGSNCTEVVWDALREQGIIFPFEQEYGHDGGVWIDHCKQVDGTPPVYRGENALSEMFVEWSLPVHNIVVCTPGSNEYGHVTLINRVYEENGIIMVEYTDSYHGHGCNELSEWESWHTPIKGIAIMGPGK